LTARIKVSLSLSAFIWPLGSDAEVDMLRNFLDMQTSGTIKRQLTGAGGVAES